MQKQGNKKKALSSILKSLPPFKISCSQIGLIMTESKPKGGLSVGAKTYCENWLLSKIYEKQKMFQSKYTNKGILCEEETILFLEDAENWGIAFKNDIRKSSDYIHGECDVLLVDKVVDIKNSFDFSTFPIFENEIPDKNYNWQIQGYMHLYKRKKGEVIYCLMDAPEEIIRKEAYFKLGRDYTEIQYLDFAQQYFYSHFPNELRIKKFEFEFDSEKIKAVEDKVKLCREYIKELILKIKNKKV